VQEKTRDGESRQEAAQQGAGTTGQGPADEQARLAQADELRKRFEGPLGGDDPFVKARNAMWGSAERPNDEEMIIQSGKSCPKAGSLSFGDAARHKGKSGSGKAAEKVGGLQRTDVPDDLPEGRVIR